MLPFTVALAACGTPAATPAAPAVFVPSPLDASVDAPIDGAVDATLHVGAVPVPGEYEDKSRTIRAFDTTVDVKDLPPPTAKWRDRKTLAYRGEVAVALHIHSHANLALTIVDTVTETPSGYPGALETFELGPIDESTERPGENNAFTPRDIIAETGQYVGPVMFAIRVLPHEGAAEAERRQYVAYTHGKTIMLAEKLVTEATWTPRLRLDAPRATKLVAMNPGWH